jgi:hypothetical protein
MKKLEAWFENGIDDDALTRICEILINHDAKFYVTEEGDSICPECKGERFYAPDSTGMKYPCHTCHGEGKICRSPSEIIEPWTLPNSYGEMPGAVCCMRANGKVCFEHDKENYEFVNNKWIEKR